MAWKGVHLTQPSRLSLAGRQLRVDQADGETTIPLEDIAWIIADNHQTSLSVSLLAACADWGIVLITSDSRHMPSALTLPFHTHGRTAAIARLQLDMSVPLKKRLWQSIVRTKIRNQSAALQRVGVGALPPLDKMAARVRSGDPVNMEARAARSYWQALFVSFNRSDDDDLRNKALNYAYAVLRACIARALTAAGFLPAVGLHHDSMTNAFNLADDIIEPFRPLADVAVFEMVAGRADCGELTREDRQQLAGLPLKEVAMAGGNLAILHASEAVAQSLARALEAKNPALLILPGFPEPQQALPGLLR